MNIRNYKKEDYLQVEALYKDSSTFGGQYDDARDTATRLNSLVAEKANCILVAETKEQIVGTVTIFEDGRSCWLYRFAVKDNDNDVTKMLTQKAKEECKKLGHEQILVYAPAGNTAFESRYVDVGFNKGNNYTAYWMNI